MRLTIAHLATLTACFMSLARAANILGIFPDPGRSHIRYNEAIMKSLHAAGHRVTMISPFSPNTKTENFTYVYSHTKYEYDTIKLYGKAYYRVIHEIEMSLDIRFCSEIMRLKEIQEALNSKEKLYDVMLIEFFVTHKCYLPIAEKLGVPIIATGATFPKGLVTFAMGFVSNPAVLPPQFWDYKLDMNYIQRVLSTCATFIREMFYKITTNEMFEKFHRDHFTEDELSEKQVSMIFCNSHPALLPYPIPPNVVEVGGIHLPAVNSLPTDLQHFIDEAPHGVILFSLGTIVEGSSLTLEQQKVFLTAFESIPQRVLWKFEEPIDNLPANVMLRDWFPQRDILAHKNVIAFMSHCGMNGVIEAVVSGTPIITIPLLFDQKFNANVLCHRGVGVKLNLHTVTKELVLSAINAIINDTSYYERMQEISRAFQDRPKTPQELVVYWTEYVIRHNGAPHLRSSEADMPLYKYFMLDIFISVYAFTCLTIFTTYVVITKYCSSFRRKRK